MHLFSIISYVLAMIVQLFICCWCGHELSAKVSMCFSYLDEPKMIGAQRGTNFCPRLGANQKMLMDQAWG